MTNPNAKYVIAAVKSLYYSYSNYSMALKKPVQRSDQWHRGMMKRIKGDYTYSILPGLFILINGSGCLGLIERVHRG